MKILIATALLATAFAVSAHEVNLRDAGELPVYEVKTLYSTPTETRSEFIKRVAPEFAAYTEETGHEACGVVSVLKNGPDGVNPTFSIVMTTIKAQIACAGDKVADGYFSMQDTIHSHPQKRVVRLTAVDMKARGTPAGKLRTENLNNCEFSGQDYAHAGFLITCGKVMYQHGRGTEQEI